MPTTQQRIAQATTDASPSLARVGHWMSAHPIQTLAASAEEIAEATGTSVAAIHRFAVSAGFEGFTHLKSALGRELASVVAPMRKIGGVRAAALASTLPEGAASAQQIERAAAQLLKARQVYLLGLGTSSFVAGYAAHLLAPYLPRAWPIAGPGGTEVAARWLAGIGATDVLLAISLPRYSVATVQLAQFARERRAQVIAITDSPQAPLARVAQRLLLAPAAHAVLPSSVQAAVSVVEAMVAEVIRLNPDAQRLAQEMSEAVLAHLTTEAGSHDPNIDSPT